MKESLLKVLFSHNYGLFKSNFKSRAGYDSARVGWIVEKLQIVSYNGVSPVYAFRILELVDVLIPKGLFTNYVDKFLAFFDNLLLFVYTFYFLKEDTILTTYTPLLL